MAVIIWSVEISHLARTLSFSYSDPIKVTRTYVQYTNIGYFILNFYFVALILECDAYFSLSQITSTCSTTLKHRTYIAACTYLHACVRIDTVRQKLIYSTDVYSALNTLLATSFPILNPVVNENVELKEPLWKHLRRGLLIQLTTN